MPSFKESLEKLTREKAPGPAPSISSVHLLLALERIAAGPIGRNKLAEELRVGEGVIRTLIDRLRSGGLIEVSKSGCHLTEKGQKLFNEYSSIIKKTKIGKNELTLTEHGYAVLVRNGALEVKAGIEQRDAAIIAGAKSATTIVCRDGRLAFPFPSRGLNDYLKASTQIQSILSPKENDAIIIVDSDKSEKAEYGALAAALTLVENGS